MATFVGIDLGTTNSAVAHRNAYGRPEVIANREGQNITPSVVYFGTDPPAVGQEAKEWARLGNEEIASFFKPHMGNPQFQLRFRGKSYSATELSTIVLRRLKEDAEARLGEAVDRAVITVPAYFADPQRKATIEAGTAAGFRVMRIINEPTAAALAYGLQKAGVEETVLIYDLGGGTFDVTVARITPAEIVVLSTAGDHDLGGKNWDDRIATFLAERFAAETGFDPLDDPLGLERGPGPQRAGQVDALRTRLGADHAPARHRAADLRARPAGVRGDDLPAHGADATPDRGGTRRGGPDLAQARRSPAGRRVHADADGPVVCLADVGQAAAGGGQRRRGRGAGRGHPGGHRGRRGDRRRRTSVHAGGVAGAGRTEAHDRRPARTSRDRRDVA